METKRIKTDSRICWKTREKKCLLQLNNFDIINESSRTMFILLWKYWEALCHFRFLKINVSCYIFNLSPPITGRMLRHWVKIVLHWYNLFIAQSDDKLPLQNPTQSSTTNPLLTKINIKQDPTCYFAKNHLENLIHLFWDRSKIAVFWENVSKKLKQCILRSTHYPIYLSTRPDTSKRNFCFLSVRHHIRSCRANNNIPLLASFLLPHKSHWHRILPPILSSFCLFPGPWHIWGSLTVRMSNLLSKSITRTFL